MGLAVRRCVLSGWFLVAAAGCVLCVLLALPSAALAAPVVTFGPGGDRVVCTITGTDGDDVLVGTEGADVICGLGGDDILVGGQGPDVLHGGGGHDRLYGQADGDTLIGSRGADLLYGGPGDDVLYGGQGADRLYGQAGNDRLRGGAGADTLVGGRGADRLYGQAGNDRLRGGAGADWLRGGPGRDRASVGLGDRYRSIEAPEQAPGLYEPGPSKSSDPPGFTQALVQQAINLYDALGRDAAVDFYSSPESVDGTWYVFLGDEESTALIANGAFPGLVGLTADQVRGPNGYPIGEVIAAVADEDGAWVDYTFTNPVSGNVETKHSWVILHDGILFGSGWYEPGPSKSSDPPGFTQALVQQAINLYDALGRDAAVDFYSSPESVDGTWYVFLVGEDGVTFAHPNPRFIGRDPSLRVDATGYFYGDDLLSATEQGRWVDYVLENPETGESEQKHTWVVRHDGILFGSGWYEP